MRRLTGAAFVSLDGVMQAPGGPSEDPTGGFRHGGWVFGHPDPIVDTVLGALFAPPYALLLGRRTYDIFAAYWPYVTGAAAGMGKALSAADKHVLSRSDAPLAWENSHRLDGIDAVAALKRSAGPDLLIQGSGTLYPPLLAAGLIDRLILMIHPIVLGTGKRLLGPGGSAALRLVEQRTGEAGVIVATYAPAGAVQQGNPPEAPPESAREQARQRAMAEGSW